MVIKSCYGDGELPWCWRVVVMVMDMCDGDGEVLS